VYLVIRIFKLSYGDSVWPRKKNNAIWRSKNCWRCLKNRCWCKNIYNQIISYSEAIYKLVLSHQTQLISFDMHISGRWHKSFSLDESGRITRQNLLEAEPCRFAWNNHWDWGISFRTAFKVIYLSNFIYSRGEFSLRYGWRYPRNEEIIYRL